MSESKWNLMRATASSIWCAWRRDNNRHRHHSFVLKCEHPTQSLSMPAQSQMMMPTIIYHTEGTHSTRSVRFLFTLILFSHLSVIDLCARSIPFHESNNSLRDLVYIQKKSHKIISFFRKFFMLPQQRKGACLSILLPQHSRSADVSSSSSRWGERRERQVYMKLQTCLASNV